MAPLSATQASAIGAAELDGDFDILLDALERAFDECRPVVVMGCWRYVKRVTLLPFHVHLACPDRLSHLPLTAGFGIVPFFERDRRTIERVLYDAWGAAARRSKARLIRADMARPDVTRPAGLCGDLQPADWELGLTRSDLDSSLTLPATCFVSLDRVRRDGQVERGSRPVLGRCTVRRSVRPYVRVLSKSGLTADSFRALADVTVLLINLQGVRGRRALEATRATLESRGLGKPTLIVAMSPGELISFGLERLTETAGFVVIEEARSIRDVSVSPVGRERPLSDREFAFAFEELAGVSPMGDFVIECARSAWWAIQQSLFPEEHHDLRHFSAALARLAELAPQDGALFQGGADMLRRQAALHDRASERLEALCDAILTASGPRILVLVRSAEASVLLRQELARRLEVRTEDLDAFDIRVQTPFEATDDFYPCVVVVAGYCGRVTLDAVLACRAPSIYLILDPIEARVAWLTLSEYERWLELAGAVAAADDCRRIKAALDAHIAPFAETQEFTWRLTRIIHEGEKHKGPWCV